MPVYDYGCPACGHRVEVIHPVDGKGPDTCPVCGGGMRKLLSRPAIVFKGSGWAKKDARSSSKRPADDGKSASSEGAAEKSSDKPAEATPKESKSGDD